MPTHQSPTMLKSALPCAQNNAIELLAKECSQDNDSVEYTHSINGISFFQPNITATHLIREQGE